MGASASMMPHQIDRETFQRLAGEFSIDAIFDQHSVDGFISREKLISLSTRTIFSSYDRALDRYGRKNQERVTAINRYLSKKGLDSMVEEQRVQGANHIPNMYDSINRARCVLVFLTSSYASKITINNNSSADHCQLEFNYILRNKKDEHVLYVIMEDVLTVKNSVFLPPVIREALQHSANFNFSDDYAFESKCEELYKIILSSISLPLPVSKSEGASSGSGSNIGTRRGSNSNNGNIHGSGTGTGTGTMAGERAGEGVKSNQKLNSELNPECSPESEQEQITLALTHLRNVAVPKTREELQLYQWLARATKISENRRIVYFAAFTRSGATNVNKLAKQMMTVPGYLLSMGLNDFDADEVCLAVADLGLGVLPVTDFSSATSIDSATYAVKKSLAAPLDTKIAVNALVCVARIARSSRSAPTHMGKLGFCESIYKILVSHISASEVVEKACLAIVKIATDNLNNIERFGVIGMCDLLSRSTARHLSNPTVVENLCCAISLLATNSGLREKFGVCGTCELITRALPHLICRESNAEQACRALSSLSMMGEGIYEGTGSNRSVAVNLNDNVWKLGQNNACQLIIQCLHSHCKNSTVTLYGLMTITALSTNDENRNRLSEEGVAESMICAALTHENNPIIAEQACKSFSCIVYGNAFNSKRLGEGGACDYVRAVLVRFQNDFNVVKQACIAVSNLAAGNPHNCRRFEGLTDVLNLILLNNEFDESIKIEVKNALSKLR